MNQILPDNAQRQTALDPSRSFIVQAPAGSGKTGLLVRRFLTLLASCNEPEEILAITFTRKATAEMSRRILNALASVHDPDIAKITDPDIRILAQAAFDHDQNRQWHLLKNPRRLRIQTIDSLSYDIVKSMPWSSRFGAAPNLLENDQATQAYLEAAKRTLEQVDRENQYSPYCAELLRLVNADFQRAQKLLAMMLGKRDHWMRGANFNDNTRHQFEQMWSDVITDEISSISNSISDGLKQQIATAARFSASNLESLNPSHPLCSCLNLSKFPDATPEVLDQWRGIAALLLTNQGDLRKRVNIQVGFPPQDKDEKEQVMAVLNDIRDEPKLIFALSQIPLLPDPKFTDKQWCALAALLHLLPVAVAELKLGFMENNLADYSEISQRAEWALGDNDAPSDLALSMDYQLSHLLMDEVQDTSRAQITLLEKLTRGWQSGDGRTLFFVGDPMQSIYRFREADVGNFLNLQKFGIGDVRPERLTLSSNFRSDARLVAWHNRVFSQIFPDSSNVAIAAVDYSPSQAVRPKMARNDVKIHAALDSSGQSEALVICDEVMQELASSPDTTIGILGRARNHLVEIAAILRNKQIPFQAVELERMSHRPAIQDLMTLTRALLQFSDRIAWLALLRAPWCGLGLKDISVLAMSDHSSNILELAHDQGTTNNMSDAGKTRLKVLLEQLSAALSLRGRVSLRKNVQTAWLCLGGPACIDAQELDDCEKFLQLLDTVEQENDQITPEILSTAVNNLWSHSSIESRIQLLTIHKAKGLEFDVVFLPQLHRQTRNQDQALLRWTRIQDRLLVAALSHSDAKNDDKFNVFLRALEKQKQINEDYRLIYVACTRAKQKLHLFMGLNKDAEGNISTPVSGSLLKLLWPALENEILSKYSSSAGQGIVEQPSLLLTTFYRLPLGWTQPSLFEGFAAKSESTTESSRSIADIEFSWVGEALRITGITVHRILQQIGSGSWVQWKSNDTDRQVSQYRIMLIEHGLTGIHLTQATENLKTAIENMKADHKAEWIFSDQHSQSRSEWPLTGVIDGIITNIIIDRSFIDDQGTRWIIDFKSSRHEGSDIQKFLAQEKSRYQQQLEQYARTVRLLEGNEIRVGLYFPLLKEWCEWTPAA